MREIKEKLISLPPLSQLLFLVVIIIVSSTVLSLVLLLFSPYFNHSTENTLSDINFLKLTQILGHFATFIIPAFIFLYLFTSKPVKFLNAGRKSLSINILLSIIIISLFLPFVNFLGELNLKLFSIDFLSPLFEIVKKFEDEAEKIVKEFLSVKTFTGFLLNIFMIAIIPAVGEELIFRGIVMNKLYEHFKKIHLSVFISALIFSAIHFQFLGFIPRFFLGLLLGYFYVYTKNLWIPIIAHFVNNATAVIVAYLAEIQLIKYNYDNFGNFNDKPLPLLFTTIISFAILIYFISLNRKNISTYLE